LLAQAHDGDSADIGAKTEITVEDAALTGFALAAGSLDLGREILFGGGSNGARDEELAIGREANNGGVMELRGAGMKSADGFGDSANPQHSVNVKCE